MRRTILAVVASALLAGCATTAKYEAMLNTWVGHSEDELIRRWGPPDRVYETSSSKYLQFSRSASGYVPGTPPSYQTTIVGNTAYTNAVGGSPGFAYTNWCNTIFELQSGVVRSWRWEGNACKAK